MIALSQAVLRGQGLDPLDAALQAVQSSPEWSIRSVANLHAAWPHLGESVRRWPKLAEELEDTGIIPRSRPLSSQTGYRREIHVSLWRVLDLLHEAGCTNAEIADILKARGL